MSKTTNKFAPEVRTRAVSMVQDLEADNLSRRAAIVSISEKIVCVLQTLFEWVKKAVVNTRCRHSYLGGISPLAFEAKVA